MRSLVKHILTFVVWRALVILLKPLLRLLYDVFCAKELCVFKLARIRRTFVIWRELVTLFEPLLRHLFDLLCRKELCVFKLTRMIDLW